MHQKINHHLEIIKRSFGAEKLDAPIARQLELVADVVEDVLLAVDRQTRLEVVERTNGILVQGETLLQREGPHRLVENVAAREVENPAVVLIPGQEPE